MSKMRQIALHLLIWAALVLMFMYISSEGEIVYSTVVMFVYFGVINILVFYANYLVVLPAFLDRKRYFWCTVAMFVLVLISSVIKCGMAYYFYDIILVRGAGKKEVIEFWDYYFSTVFFSCFFIFLSTILKFAADWFANEKVKSQLENEKLAAELAFLKSQINPHFLFNSLNNIYSLAYQKSDQTPEAVLKLSEIMRYMLYESNGNKVELNHEVRYLKNFVELQQLRFKEKTYISFDIEGDIQNKKITPLILISFVENAFKHGVATDPENPIHIVLSVSSDKLFFQVSNKKHHQNKDETGGIGLQNVRRRLDLLYPNKYRLHIEDNEEVYNCELYLNL